jgi:hypothetical protein
MLIQAKGFSRHALDEVSGHRAPAGARRDRQAQARMSFMVCEYRQSKVCVAKSPAALPYCTKLGRLVQTLARPESEFDRPPARQPRVFRRQGQRRLRPFARRRASTRRPLFVAMRARNPCVRTRCRLLGLKVRFIRQLELKVPAKSTIWPICEKAARVLTALASVNRRRARVGARLPAPFRSICPAVASSGERSCRSRYGTAVCACSRASSRCSNSILGSGRCRRSSARGS